MRACTQKCHEHGQLEISVHCDDKPFLASTLPWLLTWLENEVASGRRFLPEQTLQVGWSLLQIRQRTDRTLGLFEPDFKSMPIQFVDDVTNTLLHLFLQKSVAESLDLVDEMQIPSLLESGIICTDFEASEKFIMSRESPQINDSGWFIGCAGHAHDHQRAENLRRVSLYEAAVFHSDRIIPFLGLPPDTLVDFAGTTPFFTRGKHELAISPGSYLYRKYVEKTG